MQISHLNGLRKKDDKIIDNSLFENEKWHLPFIKMTPLMVNHVPFGLKFFVAGHASERPLFRMNAPVDLIVFL